MFTNASHYHIIQYNEPFEGGVKYYFKLGSLREPSRISIRERNTSLTWHNGIKCGLTLLMYLQPHTDLQPHTSESYFQSQPFVPSVKELVGSGSGSVGSFISDKLVMPGSDSVGGVESKCGDNERIRGRSISIIFLIGFSLTFKESSTESKIL